MAVATATCDQHELESKPCPPQTYVVGPRRPGCYPVPTYPGSNDPEFFTIKFDCTRGKEATSVLFSYMCPLCDQPIGPRRDELFKSLPKTKISTLVELYRSIWPHTTSDFRISNKSGRRVLTKTRGTPDRESVCRQHRYESLILPLAIIFKWPRVLDSQALRRRVVTKLVLEELAEVYIRPQSTVLNMSRVTPDSALASRSMREIMGVIRWGREPPRVCGYYGEQGFELIVNSLLLIEDSVIARAQSMSPEVDPLDDYECFVTNIGVHQVAAVLVSQDYGIGLADAAHMIWLSEPYGEREFPIDNNDPILRELRSSERGQRIARRRKRFPSKMTTNTGARITRSTRPQRKCLLPGLGIAY